MPVPRTATITLTAPTVDMIHAALTEVARQGPDKWGDAAHFAAYLAEDVFFPIARNISPLAREIEREF